MKRSDIAQALDSSGGKGDNETLRRAFEALEAKRGVGWISATDTQYTSSSPLSCSAGTSTPLTLTYTTLDDGGQWSEDMGSQTIQGSKFFPLKAGDVYAVRVGLTLRTDADMQSGIRGILAGLLTGLLVANVDEKQNDVEIGIDFGIFKISDTVTAPRKEGEARDFTRNFEVQIRSTSAAHLIANGGQLYIKPQEDTEVYDIDLSVRRVFAPES